MTVMLLLVVPTVASAQSTWTGATNNDWSDAGNWTPGPPGSGDLVIIGASPNAPQINSPSQLGGVVILAGFTGTVQLSGSLGVTGNVTIDGGILATNFQELTVGAAITGSGTLNATGSAVTVAGGVTINTYTPGTSLTFTGSGNWAGASNFGSVFVSGPGVTVTIQTSVTTSAIQVDDGATVNLNTLQLTVGGDLTLGGVGTGALSGNAGSTLRLTGNGLVNAGSTVATTVSTVFAGAAQSFTPPDTEMGDVTINAGSTVTLAGALLAGSLDVLPAGTLIDAGNSVGASGAIDFAGTATLTGSLAATGAGTRPLRTVGNSVNALQVSDTAVLVVTDSLMVQTTTTIDSAATLRLETGATTTFGGTANLAGSLQTFADTTFGGALAATSGAFFTATSANDIAITFDEVMPVTFPAGSTLIINPPGGTTVALRSAVPGDRWEFVNEGTITINNVAVSDSNATVDITGTGLVDGGNNNGAWPFDNQGVVCAILADCRSGFCVDGICCESACGNGAIDDCQGCATALTGQANGLCRNVTAGSSCGDAATECSAQDTCDAGGTCQVNDLADGAECTTGGTFCAAMDTCSSGMCVDGAVNPCTAEEKCVEATMQCIEPCGDGELDTDEECDEGGANSDTEADTCRTDCRNPSCGDGTIDTGETCDDADENSEDPGARCRPNCALATCGDGVIDPGEDCDDGVAGNMDVSDTCRTTCASPACGDGIVDTGEACDDGPNNSDDGACGIDCEMPEDDGGCGCRATSPVDWGLTLPLVFGVMAMLRRRPKLTV